MTISGKLLHSIDQKKEEQSDFKHVVAATLVLSSVFFSVRLICYCSRHIVYYN